MDETTRQIVQLAGGLIQVDGQYKALDGFNLVAAIRLLDDGKPISVNKFAETFGLGKGKLARRKAKRWIRQLARRQYTTENPIIGTYEVHTDGTPIPNGRLLEIQMYTANGSVEERQALAALRKKKQHLGKKLLGEADWIEGLEKKEPTTELVPA